ncbi:type II toxin-antitoxin system RelE/ParE family toxin [Ihubacter massiliensis]|uniref:type II toxin-antitoxin system RelE/ParE family toxin n=1 Tax=Ihubacter massiliensis TaxID=1852367 RepID=UPI0011DE5317|nr:type II toxin-antitoxin system RelE/ParE family toxin [Ihubacter massiliensis]MCO7122043.1 type II toxin-antitoxin system RelE/ParE family toxin [Ihubacter massiliensis]MCO7124159.1 type II toxin-antitoxin system RelE/ParE family toxin [Ihubacter massiliensis]
MDKHKVQIKLIELFSRFDYHEDVLEEIEKLVIKPGKTKIFMNLFQKNIKMVEELGNDVIKTNNFEKLQGFPNLYSMKFISPGMNLRILYSYDKVSSTIILHCFYEKDDSGKASYNKHIPIALKRREELEEKA